MPLSHCDEIAVTMPCYRINIPKSKIFSLHLLSFLPSFCAAVCFQLLFPPISLSLCAWVSNELVRFGFLFLPQAYFSSHLHHPPIPPPPPSSAILFSSLNASSPPKDFPGCSSLCFFLLFSAFTFPPSFKELLIIFPQRRRIRHAALPRAACRSASRPPRLS